jgi:hypothetical protein
MADTKDKSKDTKVMDVAKPDKPTPEIVSKTGGTPGHSLMTDSTPEHDNPSQTVEDTKEPAVTTSSKVKIEPISKPEDLKPEADDKPEPKSDASSESSTDDSDDTSEGRDKLKDADRDEQELINKKEAERQANLDKIALAKMYYLPINQVVRRRSKHVAVTGVALIVLLGIAWVDVSLDAGLISIPGVKAPTHFFSK